MNHPYRILIVEDSSTQALRLRLLFEAEGWEVVCAETAETALAQLAGGLPDLLVVDYYLPGIRGDELCRQIRMNVHIRGVPILMLTVEEIHLAETRGLESGADDYLPKSVDSDILLLRVRALLRQSESAVPRWGDSFFGRARLLAIDDSPTYLQYLMDELRSEPYGVEQATGGEEGLGRLAGEPFDCVLVDLVMPDLDGIQVCRRIREMHLDSIPAVLILTAHENKDDMTRGLDAGADDFVGKSSDMAVLKARIRALLRRKFVQEENRRIVEELKNKELEAARTRAEKEAAEARATLAEELAEVNRKLKEAQMHLIQTEKMASLGQLVAGIAHEINNPLAFALNNLFLIEQEAQRLIGQIDPPLPASVLARLVRIRELRRDVQKGLERVKELVADLRTFSRLDQGNLTTIDVPESIESVLRFLHHQMKNRIRVDKEYGPVHTLSCYGGQLNQVLMNIIANAVDAIEGEGTITISTRAGNGTFLISVRDTGRGIPKAIRHRIFEPFFTTKPVGRGTGLGLAISYGIIQAHGGRIEVVSPPGGGTEFVIKIPLNLEGASDYGASQNQRRSAGGG
ncbi:MAG: response regulator [Acidobacteria bacterium]|nr:response regulator [Acidobacteriota bacterium]